MHFVAYGYMPAMCGFCVSVRAYWLQRRVMHKKKYEEKVVLDYVIAARLQLNGTFSSA